MSGRRCSVDWNLLTPTRYSHLLSRTGHQSWHYICLSLQRRLGSMVPVGAERWLELGLVARRGHARKKQCPETGAGECLASFRHLLLYFGAALRLTAPCIRDSLTIVPPSLSENLSLALSLCLCLSVSLSLFLVAVQRQLRRIGLLRLRPYGERAGGAPNRRVKALATRHRGGRRGGTAPMRPARRPAAVSTCL